MQGAECRGVMAQEKDCHDPTAAWSENSKDITAKSYRKLTLRFIRFEKVFIKFSTILQRNQSYPEVISIVS